MPGVKFIWDEDKNAENKRKHGIDLSDVPSVFDSFMVTFPDRRLKDGEDRWGGIGWLNDVLAVAVFTEPLPDTIRIISARKASRHEQFIYTKKIGN